ncbi:Pheromone-binding protein-related protein 1 [Trachymyrmex septentrionalis]|uniref:Pheromone-binding protein-related protein 1 n=1 Tax=Trachymyrmex septentrionalis TaxID=34720 RepID=A0A151JYK2_9HYME|nr:PREDICTED: general odorant-binding protein 69a-like isoform X1 [Trachymyrmex septentrionalis]KYN41523.1 Pheromone-binding protein-related protein 1 [Trachymyrmex septentrionalis]
MHVPVILGVVLLQAIYVSAGPPDWIPAEMLEMVQADKERCMAEHGTSQVSIDEVNDGKLSNDRSITCYMNCLLDAFSLVDEEGNLEADMLISVIPEQFQEIGNKILNKCAKQDGADACEKIYEVAKCVQGTVPEVNRLIVSSQ